MQQLTLRVRVDRKVAIDAGVAMYGETDYPVSDAELQSLSAEERRWIDLYATPFTALQRYVQSYFPAAKAPEGTYWSAYGPVSSGALSLDTPQVTWDEILAAVRRDAKSALAIIAKADADARVRAEELAKKTSASDAIALRWMAASDDEMVPLVEEEESAACYYGVRIYYLSPHDEIHWCNRSGSRVEPPSTPALAEQFKAILERRTALSNERRAEWNARRRAADDAKLAALRAYAATIPDLARAVAEEYDFHDALISNVCNLIAHACLREGAPAPLTVLVEGSRPFSDAEWIERKAPTPQALETRDKIVAAVEKVKSTPLFPRDYLDVRTTRVQRVLLPNGDDEPKAKPFTGIIVKVEPDNVPGARHRYMVFTAE